MEKNIQLNEISIKIVRKNIKNTHLSVYPPNGRVILVTPKKLVSMLLVLMPYQKLNGSVHRKLNLRDKYANFQESLLIVRVINYGVIII